MTREELLELAEQVDRGFGPDNMLDVLVEIALFKPDKRHVSVQPNAAGTKVVFIRPNGSRDTYLASDWTLYRRGVADALRARARARAQTQEPDHG